jgi:hypothetical protein
MSMRSALGTRGSQAAAAVGTRAHCSCWVPKRAGSRRNANSGVDLSASVSDQPSTSSSQPANSGMPANPWSFGFQCNERYIAACSASQDAMSCKTWRAGCVIASGWPGLYPVVLLACCTCVVLLAPVGTCSGTHPHRLHSSKSGLRKRWISQCLR